MTITIQPTGYPPVQLEPLYWASSTQVIGRRVVTVELMRLTGTIWGIFLSYISKWPDERDYRQLLRGDILVVTELARMAAKSMLPPGAGYPATPDFADRQRKLVGQLEQVTLAALTEVLAQARGEGQL
jgi:hypothetical protein